MFELCTYFCMGFHLLLNCFSQYLEKCRWLRDDGIVDVTVVLAGATKWEVSVYYNLHNGQDVQVYMKSIGCRI